MGDSDRFHCTALGMRTWFIALVVTIAKIWPTAVFSDDKPVGKPDTGPASKMPPIVCLHTEHTPLKEKKALQYRLMRELGRQALLIAARDELGLSTRDETLGEVFPESVTQAKQDVYVAVRSQHNGDVAFQLWLSSKPEELLPPKPIRKYDPRSILNQTEKLEAKSRGDLCEKLRSLGFGDKIAPPNEKNRPPHTIEDQLLEMNFVSQFAAVRAAHAAIAEEGQSRAWLGVLARGYANLSLLTEHHWKCDTEVFTARALLYAERLAAANPDDSNAIAHRAYVRMLVGLHGPALEDLKSIQEIRTKHTDQPSLPNWYEVIEPYCTFKRESLTAIGKQQSSLRQLVQRLSFEQVRAYGDERWLFESGKQTMIDCAEDYSVPAILTNGDAPLSVGRIAASAAPNAMAQYLPLRIADLPELPPVVRDAATVAKSSADDQPDDKKEAAGFAAATIPIVEALRTATRSDDDRGEPSWSALGELIFEEQFVQAAHQLHISLNATESSFDDEVNSMRPAIKGHRYARFIESFVVKRDRDRAAFAKVIGDMQIVDPRGNMAPMFSRLWILDKTKEQYGRGALASFWSMMDTSITFNGMLEAYTYAGTWWQDTDKTTRQRWAKTFRAVSPHAPLTLRTEISVAEHPGYEDVVQWKSEAGDDPVVLITIGWAFAALEHYDDAILCYERSVRLSPTKAGYVGLANAYRWAGKEELWQPTLERFLNFEPLGLENASVHRLIADDLMDKGKWEEAKPHAIAAGETWSSWGLETASHVAEGLGQWEESEKWIRADSQAYPSSSGDQWYYWCRRTGRGDLDAARKAAQLCLQADWVKKNIDGHFRLLTFHLLENDPRAAFVDAQNLVKMGESEQQPVYNKIIYQLHLAMIARELNEKDVAKSAIQETRRLGEQDRKKYPDFSDRIDALCDVFDGKSIEANQFAKIDEFLAQEGDRVERCNHEYFFGRTYDLAGNKDLADKYWKRCVMHGPFTAYSCTLSGKYLSDRHKTSRP